MASASLRMLERYAHVNDAEIAAGRPRDARAHRRGDSRADKNADSGEKRGERERW
jgi:hypothetical protein